MKKQKIVKVRKWFQKVKVVEITDDFRPILVKKLCQIVHVGHKVYIEFDKKIARTLIDLTLMFGENNIPNVNKIFPQPYYKYEEGEKV